VPGPAGTDVHHAAASGIATVTAGISNFGVSKDHNRGSKENEQKQMELEMQ
jgi:hypothetical protein